MSSVIRKAVTRRSSEALIALLSSVAFTIIGALLIAALYFGREIFVPLALAILLSFVLAPVVGLLQRIRVPRGLAVVGVVVLAFIAIFGLGSLVAQQLTQLAGDLPRYEATMREKIKSVRGAAASSGTLERAADMLQELSKELDKPKDAKSIKDGVGAPTIAPVKPVPVEVRQPDPGALESIRALIAPLLHPLATTGIIIIFVIFILLQREDLRNRLIRLAGSHDLQRTTAALDDAASRLSRLLLIQLLLNSAFGLIIGVGLSFIGVPSAILWGVLAGVLRFVPYIGAVISAAFPLALAAAVDPSWSMLLWTLALFVVVEPIVGHVIEPMVYGQSTGLSPVAIVASATFWTALWGPIGLVLATPLTVCLVVLGRHIERLEFLDVIFGDKPALSPAEMFYQRMLAGDPTEAAEKAEAFLKEKSLSAYFDEVAIKGLQLAQIDAKRGALDYTRMSKIRDAVDEFASDLSDQVDFEPEVTAHTKDSEAAAAVESISDIAVANLPALQKQDLEPNWQGECPVLCVAARTPLDEAAARLFGQLANAHGLAARIKPAEALSTANIFRLETAGVALVCLSYLDVSSPAHMRYAVQRLRRKLPNAAIMIGCWAEDFDSESLEALRATAKADIAAGSLREAIATCHAMASQQETIPNQGTPLAIGAIR
ncbi:AI-2E family transporter [Bradyrhizobium sp. SYSU BS000235]|uniref:AI-2E family transporter n=1 Tax=Bradyrhizobium sp. SYSU BS000235 TaxID=3411332 RepID=UPI003C74C287